MSDAAAIRTWLETSEGGQLPVGGNVTLGRTPDNGVLLTDDRVSRRHALIHVQGGEEYWLVDLGSRNGTYVNERRVHQPIRLSDGDQIRIGPFRLTFRQTGGAPMAASRDSATQSRTFMDLRPQACWLLVADIAGSTPLARSLSPEALSVLMGHWFLRCRDIIETAGGTVNKYLGDGFLAFWIESEKVLAAMATTIAALRRLQREGQPRFRLVVHSGEVLLGGVASLGEESLSGPAVNFAFRIERLAAELGEACLVSEVAATRLGGAMAVEWVGNHALPGFDGHFALFRPSATV